MPSTTKEEGFVLPINNNATIEQAHKVAISMSDFDKALPKIARQGKALRDLVQQTALQALIMAFAHDNFDPLTKLHNTVANNLSPKQAEQLKNWFIEFSPSRLAKTESGKSFRKVTGDNAKPFDFEGAYETPWYKMDNDADKTLQAILDASKLNSQLENLIKKYTKALDDNSVPESDKEKVQNTINQLETIVANQVQVEQVKAA